MIKKIVSITFSIAVIILLLNIYFAGVRLVVENESNQKIDNVQINYVSGSFSVGILESQQIKNRSIGKIGEGSNFEVLWNDKAGLHQKTFKVYFHGFSGILTVRIKILANGEAVLLEGDRLVSANN